ncbi:MULTISPECIES: sigma factor-binding protein Crl [Salinivibrio]|jgi:sigma factor-binding protein Crl|uniref:Sigma factor-binding protein Crl n=2 Tax=Salinivibrio TaxID=51366 RepID=A0ABY7LDY2_9GAMM|nr:MULTISPECIES: sigma factor-binding protein Crl [Salinivibrio]ODQ00943.1 sigma factor-binding protein Crl [Salinivibrio sp. DV]OOF10960.1 sigma factor-binding protein Crl [Salinivibrio sp. PR5]OOF21459.1 sigma factor-binding protein Crl [Salinivibrio sp. IB574]OOF24879.1 sigma factor-binding protein Crl [Salinivibrio proteolyticus]OOF32529.1 sigma factor-binding protein Crl [Salinivibrio proteolyticus]
MTQTLPLSHGRLKTRFTALGPYFRDGQSDEQSYFFDSLSVCVDAKKEPDAREFWGWWLVLTPEDDGFRYHYGYGLYDEHGEWLAKAVPAKQRAEVEKTLDSFYTKLCQLVVDELSLSLSPSQKLTEPELALSN